MYDLTKFSVLETPCPDMTMEDYDAACSRCEEFLDLLPRDRNLLLAHLHYVRKEGDYGLCVKGDIPKLGLLNGDRLEPTRSFPDVGGIFEDASSETLPLKIWRTRQLQIKHRNPLFDAALGITPTIMLVDLLHAFYLGTLQTYYVELLWELMLSEVWVQRGGHDTGGVHQCLC